MQQYTTLLNNAESNVCFISEIVVFKTKKGKTNIKIGDYTFYRKPGRGTSEKIRWGCTQNKYCKACLHSVGENIITIHNVHNHDKLYNDRIL